MIHPQLLAAIHAEVFEPAWSAADFVELIASGAFVIDDAGGFILAREAGGEAEILTLAVLPLERRQGMGRRLVEAAAAEAAARGADTLFLEVAEDNDAAIRLYGNAGFEEVGRRPGYYRRADGQLIDALILSRALNRA